MLLKFKKIKFIAALSCLIIAGCTNMGVSLDAGKKARRAGEYEIAAKHLEPLVAYGNDEAKYEMAIVLLKQKSSTAKDYERARQLLLEVKGRREGAALFEVGRMHYKGRGVARNRSKGLDYYKKAAEIGYHRADYEMGMIAMDGKRYKDAKRLCKQAFDNHYDRAAMCLGRLHEKGLGTSQNSEKALAWYLLAERRDVSRAEEKVKELTARLGSKSVSSAQEISKGLE